MKPRACTSSDRFAEIPPEAEVRGARGDEDEDSGYVSAWLWVPGLSQPVTLERAWRVAAP